MSDSFTPAYPFDPTGKLSSNKISGEQQILTEANGIDYRLIVPQFAPFFAESLVVKHKRQVNGLDEITILNEGIDYICSHWFIAGSRSCATNIFGSISISDDTLNGVINLEYQTLGGIWSIDLNSIAVLLSDVIHNPRVTSWDEVIDKPISFPPIDHEWNLNDMVGMTEVVTELTGIKEAIIDKEITISAQHIHDFNNPHMVNADQVGTYNKAEIDAKLAILASQNMSNGTATTTIDEIYFLGR